MLYFVSEEVWSIWMFEAQRKLLRRTLRPLASGEKGAMNAFAEKCARGFNVSGYQNDARYRYWWGRREGMRENHRFVVMPFGATAA
jgi:hypothetical protein